eukprot:COSAG02_NODE_13496_length_1386_cov_18.313908_2_plen_86_part_00
MLFPDWCNSSTKARVDGLHRVRAAFDGIILVQSESHSRTGESVYLSGQSGHMHLKTGSVVVRGGGDASGGSARAGERHRTLMPPR